MRPPDLSRAPDLCRAADLCGLVPGFAFLNVSRAKILPVVLYIRTYMCARVCVRFVYCFLFWFVVEFQGGKKRPVFPTF